MASRPDAVQAQIAPYTGRTSLFLFGGITLILANYLLSQSGWNLVKAFFPNAPAPATVNATQTSWLDIIGQVLLLGALLLVASVDEEAGSFALIFLAALWLGFLYNHRALVTTLVSATQVASQGGAPASNSNTAPSSNSAWLQ